MYWWIAAALSLAVAVFSFVRDRRQLRVGVFLVMALVCAVQGLIVTDHGEIVVVVVSVIVVLAAVVTAVFLIVNSVIVMRREGRSLATLLPAVAGLGIILTPAAAILLSFVNATWAGALAFLLVATALYVAFVFCCFLVFSLVYRFTEWHPAADTVLVLGSKIFDGKPPPLLTARIDRAITVYRRAEESGAQLPVLVFSGGQGADESRTEAAAMAEYAAQQGIPHAALALEERATTTRQNLRLGIAVSREHRPGGTMLIATNDYHTFRTALLAKSLGLRSQVVAAPTAGYYLPSAYLREFVAVLRDYVWWHVAVGLCLCGLVGFMVWESYQLH